MRNSIFLEISHLYIPNRAFELNDLISNIVGVFFGEGGGGYVFFD